MSSQDMTHERLDQLVKKLEDALRKQSPARLESYVSVRSPSGKTVCVRSADEHLDKGWIQRVVDESDAFVQAEFDKIRSDVDSSLGAAARILRATVIKPDSLLSGVRVVSRDDEIERADSFKRLLETIGDLAGDDVPPLVSVDVRPHCIGEEMRETILNLAVLAFLGGVISYVIRRIMRSNPPKRTVAEPHTAQPPRTVSHGGPSGAFAVIWMSSSMRPEDLDCLKAASSKNKLSAEALEIIKRCYKSKYLTSSDLNRLTSEGAGMLGPVTGEKALPGFLLGLLREQDDRFASHGDRFSPQLRTTLKSAIDEHRPPSFEVHSTSAKTVDEFGFVVV
jgi:hypothetical protein